MMKIKPDFGVVAMLDRLFDTGIGQRLYEQLPAQVDLQAWGDESYGSIGVDLGEERPVPDIPAGGIAYTNQGNYLCFFYGQRPAWPVEYIGEILNGEWNQLRTLKPQVVLLSAISELAK